MIQLTDIPEWLTAKTAIDAIALPEGCAYYRRALLNDVAVESKLVAEKKAELKAEYPDTYISTHVRDGSHVVLTISSTFDNREEMLAFAEKYSITIPKDCIKNGKIRDEKPVTSMIYTFEQDGKNFNLSYEREGFPTAHCRVVTNVSYDVACSIDGSDS